MTMAEDIRNMVVPSTLAFQHVFETPDCIVMDSSYASMGRMLSRKACEKAGWSYYDGASLLDLVPESGITKQMADQFDCRLASADDDWMELKEDEAFLKIWNCYTEAVHRALETGPCLIHDRIPRSYLKAQGFSCIAIMNYAADRVKRRERAKASPLYRSLESARELDDAIAFEDAARQRWHALADGSTTWGRPETYAAMLNADELGMECASDILAMFMGA